MQVYGWDVTTPGFFSSNSYTRVLYVDGVRAEPGSALQITPGQHTLTLQFKRGDWYATADISHIFKKRNPVIVKAEIAERKENWLGGTPPSKIAFWIEDKQSGKKITREIGKPAQFRDNYVPTPTYLKDGSMIYM